jgi:SAM-dependent methyltransferase
MNRDPQGILSEDSVLREHLPRSGGAGSEKQGRPSPARKLLKKDTDLATILGKVVRSLHSRGMAGTVYNCHFYLKELWFDWRHGLDTWGAVTLQNLDISGADQTHANHYEPTPLYVIEEVFDALQQLGVCFQQFIFVDLGSGKGRTLLRAARLRFKKVVGVEISDGLHRIAVRNISKCDKSMTGLSPIECIREDAGQFKIPAGNTILYLYHPFDKHVLGKVLTNLRASLLPGFDAYVVYVYPSLSEEIRSTGFLTRVVDRRTETGMGAYEKGATFAAPFEIWSTRSS